MYDALGNRVRKTEQRPGAGKPTTHTYYVRDAQGNPLAIYRREEVNARTISLTLVEQPLYGSQRLGERRPDLDMLTGSGARTI